MKDFAILFAVCSGAVLIENENAAHAHLGALLLSGAFFTVLNSDNGQQSTKGR